MGKATVAKLFLHFVFALISTALASTLGFMLGVSMIGDNPGALAGVFVVFQIAYLLFLAFEFFIHKGIPGFWKFKSINLKNITFYFIDGALTIVGFFIAYILYFYLISMFSDNSLLLPSLFRGEVGFLFSIILFTIIEVSINRFFCFVLKYFNEEHITL